ncbi:MAG: ribonuclease HII [Bacteroidales bacterium]|jgi:ribonuclease HII|nr:ribonuclease HII [Bacteroidales bacterium]
MLLPFYQEGVFEAGTDEAGRGPLAGPVVAAAVILPLDDKDNPLFTHPRLTDSKKLTEKQREELRPLIMEHALAYGIARVEADEIDRINILNASILAMHKAIAEAEKMLRKKNRKFLLHHIISDGNKFHPYTSGIQKKTIPHKTIVKGDATYISIAAASILAKTERDHIMDSLSESYPQYNWKKNKAYPTKDHRDAIAKYGPTPYHRMSFRLLPDPTLF